MVVLNRPNIRIEFYGRKKKFGPEIGSERDFRLVQADQTTTKETRKTNRTY